MKKILVGAMVLVAVSGCKARLFNQDALEGESAPESVDEDKEWYGPTVSAKADLHNAFKLSGNELDGILDIRGVGDSGWSGNYANTPPPSRMGSALENFDPTGEILKGDLNFMNVETTISKHCDTLGPGGDQTFRFVASPDSIVQSAKHGFNIFGLANNHTEDCRRTNSKDGALVTRDNMNKLSKDLASTTPFLWHGAGEKAELTTPDVQTFTIKGEKIKVAFAAVAFQGWGTDTTARGELHSEAILKAMKESTADIKILAIHTQDSGGTAYFKKARTLASQFIKFADGDVVFQHGPHTWAGVKVIKTDDGRQGVMFHGLGNFIHTQCSVNSDNLIGRALFDLKTKKLKQVQVVPVVNQASSGVVLRSSLNKEPISNLGWAKASLKTSKGKTVPTFYANIN